MNQMQMILRPTILSFYLVFEGRPVAAPVLGKIKGETLHEEKESNNITTDTSATKRIFLSRLRTYDESIQTPLKGLVQAIYHDPFGVLFLTSLQVCVRKIFQPPGLVDIVWHNLFLFLFLA